MNHDLFRLITNFGDTGVIFPLSFLLGAILAYFEGRRAAWLFVRALASCLGVMTFFKLLFLSCGHLWPLDIHSPSGHTALSTMFYGVLAAIVWARRPDALGRTACVGAASLILGVAVSRVALHAHSVPEVVFGALVGALCVLLFAHPYLALPHPRLRIRWLGAVLAPVFVLSYGTILPAEQMLRSWVPFLHIPFCSA